MEHQPVVCFLQTEIFSLAKAWGHSHEQLVRGDPSDKCWPLSDLGYRHPTCLLRPVHAAAVTWRFLESCMAETSCFRWRSHVGFQVCSMIPVEGAWSSLCPYCIAPYCSRQSKIVWGHRLSKQTLSAKLNIVPPRRSALYDKHPPNFLIWSTSKTSESFGTFKTPLSSSFLRHMSEVLSCQLGY